MRSKKLLLVLPLLLCGCAGIDTPDNYDDITVVRFRDSDAVWRIYDKPADKRMVVAPTIGATMDQEFVDGLTIGMVDSYYSPAQYRTAAETWLVHTGRHCQITDTSDAAKPQWEFRYRCR